MKLKLALMAVVAIAIISPSTAAAHAPWNHKPGSLKAPLIHWGTYLRDDTNQIRAGKCLPRIKRQYAPFYRVPVPLRPYAIEVEIGRRLMARVADDRCLDTPIEVIRFVFPDATEGAAIVVAACETIGFTDFLNEGSGASGIFQLMPFHFVGQFDPMDMLANARYALRLSDGGTNWGPWEASRGCWGNQVGKVAA